MEENEERSMIEPRSYENPRLQELIKVLIEWVNDELHMERIIVQDIEEDLYDGQILQKLLEKLSGETLNVPEVTQSEEGQRSKLRVVLGAANRVLGLQRQQPKWSVESVHTKNIVSILHLLVKKINQNPIYRRLCLISCFRLPWQDTSVLPSVSPKMSLSMSSLSRRRTASLCTESSPRS